MDTKKNTRPYYAHFINKVTIVSLLPGGEPLDYEEELDEDDIEDLGFKLNERKFIFSDQKHLLKILSAILNIAPKHIGVDVYDKDDDGIVRVSYPSDYCGKPLDIDLAKAESMAEIPLVVSIVPSKKKLEELSHAKQRSI